MIYADTSVLVSLIVEDGNSTAATALVRECGGNLVWTDFLKLEVFNAIRLGVAEKRLSAGDAEIARGLAGKLISSRKWESHDPG